MPRKRPASDKRHLKIFHRVVDYDELLVHSNKVQCGPCSTCENTGIEMAERTIELHGFRLQVARKFGLIGEDETKLPICIPTGATCPCCRGLGGHYLLPLQ